ncbi:MAG: M55 family metallopeptidase [Actinomycetota bacterium]|nr:M55 family metallopeptidase [Actinomycetota bacterium]
MRVYISSDMEGTAGIVDWDQCRGPGPEYELGRRLLLAEVNAAIDGAVAAGATHILVNDSHSVMQNLPADGLHGNASYLSGRQKPTYMMEGLDGSFDAVLFISYHAAMGTRGVLSHTYNPRAIHEARLDGQVAGESGINALVARHFGVPVVLVTGDQHVGPEAQRFCPGIDAVIVKRSITRFAAESLHPAVACELIRAGSERAVRRAGTAAVPAHHDSGRLEVDWLTADMAAMAAGVPGVVQTAERTTCVEGENLLAVYHLFVTTVELTRSIVE